MKSFFVNIWRWCAKSGRYIVAGVILYMIHLSVEGMAVNYAYYTVLKPLYTSLVV